MKVEEFVTSINGFDFFRIKGTRNGCRISGYRIIKDGKKIVDAEDVLPLREHNKIIILKNNLCALYQFEANNLKKISGDYEMVITDIHEDYYICFPSTDSTRIEIRRISDNSLLHDITVPVPSEFLEKFHQYEVFLDMPILRIDGKEESWFYNIESGRDIFLKGYYKSKCLAKYFVVRYWYHTEIYELDSLMKKATIYTEFLQKVPDEIILKEEISGEVFLKDLL